MKKKIMSAFLLNLVGNITDLFAIFRFRKIWHRFNHASTLLFEIKNPSYC
ncbi:MAG: hypothetical protein KBB64_04065 [Bacteroidia bacterium]|nr:hypothetical protein [Bacteroidia bacterium]